MQELKTFQDRLVFIMQHKKLKQVDLVRSLEVSKGTASNWYSGKTTPENPEQLAKLANFLGVGIGWLATGEGEISAEHTSQSSTQDYEPSTSTIEFMETLKEMERNGELTPQVIGLLNNTLNTVKSISGKRLSVSHLVEMPE